MSDKKKTVSLGPDTLQAAIDEITALDAAIDAAKGNISLLRQTVGLELLADDSVSADVERYVAMLAEAEELRAALDQKVDEAMRERAATLKGDADTLGEKRDAVSKKAEALRTILVDADMIGADEMVIPGKRKGSTTSGGQRGVKNSEATYYRVRDGVRKNQSLVQNSVSSLAYYYSAAINGKRMSTDEFRTWAKANHNVDVDSSKAWQVELKPGLAVGMEPVSKDEAPADDAKS